MRVRETGGRKETGRDETNNEDVRVGLCVSQSCVVVRRRDHLQDALCIILH